MKMRPKRKNIIMISYAFPPHNFSGTERPFQFARYLPEFGYTPLIISQKNFINFYCVENDYASLKKLSKETRLYRLKTYASFLSRLKIVKWGDKIINIVTGKKIILTRLLQIPGNLIYGNKEWEFKVFWLCFYLKLTKNPKLIWATGPQWNNLKVGYVVSKILKIPLVIDMRDPWTYGVLWHPENENDALKQINDEKKILKQATKVVFTSPLTEQIMVNKYPDLLNNKTETITNGFDVELEQKSKTENTDKFVVTYTGRFTEGIRDPEIFLEGFKLACEKNGFRNDVLVEFVGYIDDFKDKISTYNTYNNLHIEGPVSRQESLEKMFNSDVLLLIQTIHGEGNDVIGGKLYEYINARKPILAVVPENGGDAWLLKNLGDTNNITGIKNPERIKEKLILLWQNWKSGKLKSNITNDITKFKRFHLTEELGSIFDEILN